MLLLIFIHDIVDDLVDIALQIQAAADELVPGSVQQCIGPWWRDYGPTQSRAKHQAGSDLHSPCLG